MEKGKTLKDNREKILLKINNAANEREKFQRMIFANLQLVRDCERKLKIAKNTYKYLWQFRTVINPDEVADCSLSCIEDSVKFYSRRLEILTKNRKLLIFRFKNAQRRESKALRHLKGFDVRMKKQELENGKR